MAKYNPINNDANDQLVIQISKSTSAPANEKLERDPLLPPSNSNSKQTRPQHQQRRLISLDVFRGLTVALMILVDDVGGILPAINHSPWNGLTLADFVMPFFLFIVGVSLALTYKNFPCKVVATRKAIPRALNLFLLGIFLQGGFFHGINNLKYGVDIAQIRWMGVLQGCCFGAYYSVFIVVVRLVTCGVRGSTGPACNAVGMIDRKILGIQHLYRKPIYSRTKQCSINSPDYGPMPLDAPSWCQAPFDPEGLLSSVMATVTCLIGLHFGHLIVHFKDHRDRMLNWIILSSCLIGLGLSLDFVGMHLNKALYSLSYTCLTAGASGVLLAGIYFMVDVQGHRRVTMVFEWMGLHALMIYILVACNILPVLLQGFYWRQPQNNIVDFLFTS
ncbi:DUF1624 domain-containing protein [Citrus sinensis]|nr:DUF1624 domain-containing protein [Citrus sinensis]